MVHYEMLVAKITVFPKSPTLSYNYFSPSYAKLLILEIKSCHVGTLWNVFRVREGTMVIEEGIGKRNRSVKRTKIIDVPFLHSNN